MNHKQFITDYLQELSGRPKTPELVRQWVSDENLMEHIAQVEAAFPNYELFAQDMLAEDDKVVVRAEFRGVHRGPFAGIGPTGKSVTAGLIIIYRIESNRIAEHWMQFDRLALLEQLSQAAQPANA
jgi:predicted ester cyclase